MQPRLILAVSLFLVHVASCTEGQSHEDQLNPVERLTLGENIKRGAQEAKKPTIEKIKIKEQSSKKKKNKANKGGRNINKKTGKEQGQHKNNQAKTKSKQLQKFKLAERRKKNSKKTSPTNNNRQSCESGITTVCMEAAKTVLVYEGNQVINFIKKFVRYNKQVNTTGNKLGKKGLFSTPKKYMEDAMGGNMTTITGCKTETSRGNFSSNYDFLSNCSALIADKCTPVTPDDSQMTAMEKCNTEMTKIKNATESCRKLSTDGATQCTCWVNLQSDVNAIKALSPKCIETMDKMARDMRKAKKTCTDTFSLCKKAEDASVKLISDCMNFDVQALNQSKIADDAGSKLIGF